MNSGASGAALRDVNRSALLSLIAHHGPLSRAELARRLGVSPGTVTALVRGLQTSGMVEVVDTSASDGGRPAELIGLVGDAASALGVKIAIDHVTIVRASLDGTVVHSRTEAFVPTSPFSDLADVLEDEVRVADGVLLLGVGIGLPGFEDPYGSGVVQAPLLGWRHVPLADHLSRALRVPVILDNDVNTLAVAENLFGVGRGVRDFVTVTIGRGVGMGIVIDHELYRGANGTAGEFGHVTVVDRGRICQCGKRGCLETVVSDPALMAEATRRRVVPEGASMETLLHVAASGDRAAVRIFEHAGRALGRAVATATVLLDPEVVVVGGEGTRAWDLLEPSFNDALAAHRFLPRGRATPVHVVTWDDSRWALGAASLVLRAPFVTPLHEHPAMDSVRARLDAGFRAPLVGLREGGPGWSA